MLFFLTIAFLTRDFDFFFVGPLDFTFFFLFWIWFSKKLILFFTYVYKEEVQWKLRNLIGSGFGVIRFFIILLWLSFGFTGWITAFLPVPTTFPHHYRLPLLCSFHYLWALSLFRWDLWFKEAHSILDLYNSLKPLKIRRDSSYRVSFATLSFLLFFSFDCLQNWFFPLITGWWTAILSWRFWSFWSRFRRSFFKYRKWLPFGLGHGFFPAVLDLTFKEGHSVFYLGERCEMEEGNPYWVPFATLSFLLFYFFLLFNLTGWLTAFLPFCWLLFHFSFLLDLLRDVFCYFYNSWFYRGSTTWILSWRYNNLFLSPIAPISPRHVDGSFWFGRGFLFAAFTTDQILEEGQSVFNLE